MVLDVRFLQCREWAALKRTFDLQFSTIFVVCEEVPFKPIRARKTLSAYFTDVAAFRGVREERRDLDSGRRGHGRKQGAECKGAMPEKE